MASLGILDKRRRGVLPASGRLTMGVWLERWLASAEGSVRPRTMEHDQITHNHLIPSLGSKQLAKVTSSDVEAMLRQKLAAGLSRGPAFT